MIYFIYVTFPSKKEAKRVVSYIIEKRLAGCGKFFPVESIYWWKNKKVNEEEVLVIFETVKSKLRSIEKEIKRIHSYQVPEIAAVEGSRINKEYLDWLKEEIK